MKISLKDKLIIIIFSALVLSIFLSSNKVFATIDGCTDSDLPPQITFEKDDEGRITGVVNIKDPTGIKSYTTYYWETDSFIKGESKYYTIQKISDTEMKITYSHSAMEGTIHGFKISVKDSWGAETMITFSLTPNFETQIENDVERSKFIGGTTSESKTTNTVSTKTTVNYFEMNAYPIIGSLKFEASSGLFKFYVKDAVSISVTDLYNSNKSIATVSSSMGKTTGVGINIDKLKLGSNGYFYIKIYAKDDNGHVNSKNICFKCKSTATTKQNQVATLARSLKGKKYVYGTAGPNTFDCSGLVQYVYKKMGVSLPRTSTDQRSVGTAVSKTALKKGDILCFDGHVGLYVGNGKMVHAANPSRGVVEDDFKSGSYYWNKLITARRIFK